MAALSQMPGGESTDGSRGTVKDLPDSSGREVDGEANTWQ
jgi:hypothetical protein